MASALCRPCRGLLAWRGRHPTASRWATIYRPSGTPERSSSSDSSVNQRDGDMPVFTIATNHGDCNPGTPIGRLAFPGEYKAIESLTFVGQVEDFGFEEEAIQFRIEFLVLDGHFQDIECAVGGDGFLVRTVGGG